MGKIWKVVKILGVTYVILDVSALAIHGTADIFKKIKAANEEGPIESVFEFESDIISEDLHYIKDHLFDKFYFKKWF